MSLTIPPIPLILQKSTEQELPCRYDHVSNLLNLPNNQALDGAVVEETDFERNAKVGDDLIRWTN